jgi:ATP-dependent RNA circularization protein (DNA/RNA ligase family)
MNRYSRARECSLCLAVRFRKGVKTLEAGTMRQQASFPTWGIPKIHHMVFLHTIRRFVIEGDGKRSDFSKILQFEVEQTP